MLLRDVHNSPFSPQADTEIEVFVLMFPNNLSASFQVNLKLDKRIARVSSCSYHTEETLYRMDYVKLLLLDSSSFCSRFTSLTTN